MFLKTKKMKHIKTKEFISHTWIREYHGNRLCNALKIVLEKHQKVSDALQNAAVLHLHIMSKLRL